MSDKKQPTRLLTPPGKLFWPYLTRVDPEYKDYKTKIIFEDTDDFREFQKKLMVAVEESYNAALKVAMEKPNARRPKKADPFEELANGTFMVKASMKSVVVPSNGKESFTQAPRIFDAQNKPWDLETPIYSDSVARLFVELVPYSNVNGVGVSLRLKDVQILKHVGRGSGGAGSNPFGAVAEDTTPFETRPAPSAHSGGGNTDNGDF